MKKEYYYIIAILLVALGYRLYNLRQPYFIGNDAFLHASVIRQALTDGNLDTYELSYGNPKILEPKGFYYVTLWPAMLFGLEPAFKLMPLIAGLIGILLSYYLMKELFNKRVAYVTMLILALSMGHMYRSSPNTYRGDNFFLTIFIGILYCYVTRRDWLTGVLMGLSATLWGGYPIGILVIISGLIIESTIKFLKNKYEKKDLVRVLKIIIPYYLLEQLFINTGVVFELFFTSNTGLHALLVFAPLLLGFVFKLSHKLKKSNVLLLLIGVGVVLLVLNASTITSMIQQGLFENSLFYDIGVSELLPPTPELLNTMLSWTLYLMWPGLVILTLIIIKKQEPNHLTYLVWIGLSIYLLLSYSRYTFIASITTASLTALVIDYVYSLTRKQNTRIALLLPLIFLVPYTVESIINVNRVGPRMNEYWLDAITWAGQNLEPGNVITWWDHGSWVQYYAGFPTIVDSVSGQAQDRIETIARFLVSDVKQDFSGWNAKYLILGSDIILYSGAVTGIAGEPGFQASLVGNGVPATVNNEVITIYPIIDGRFEVYPNGTIFRGSQGVFSLSKTFYANSTGATVVDSGGQGCLLINPLMGLFFNDQACNSNYVNLMFGNGLEGYEELYRNDYVVIYEIV